MSKADSKTTLLNWGNNNTLIIVGIVLVIIFMFFWDRHQQRVVELRRIESKVELLEEWVIPVQQNNTNAQSNSGRVF